MKKYSVVNKTNNKKIEIDRVSSIEFIEGTSSIAIRRVDKSGKIFISHILDVSTWELFYQERTL